MAGTQASSGVAGLGEIERLVGTAMQQISSPPSEEPGEGPQQELAVLNTFIALAEALSTKVPGAYLSIQSLPAEHTLWDLLVSLYCKAAPQWLSERPLSLPVLWVQESSLALARRLDACLGGAKAALHLPAVRALLDRTTLRVSLFALQGMLLPGDLHYNYPSLLAALRLAALAGQQTPGAWGKECDAPTADVLRDLAMCAFQHCWEFAQKRLGGLTAVLSESGQGQPLWDLAEGLHAAAAVLNDGTSHFWDTFRIVPTCILEQVFAASEKAFQLFKAADRVGTSNAAVCLLRACVRCSLWAVRLLGNADFYTHPKEGPPRSLPPAYYKHSLEVALSLSASLNQATDTYGPQPGAGDAMQAAVPVTEGLRGLLRDEIEALHEAITVWAFALQHPSLISTVPELEDESYVLQYLPDAEAAGWGLKLSEQLMRLAAKRAALAAIVPLHGLYGQERDSSGMELTPCGCCMLLTTSQLPMMSMQFLRQRSLAPADLTAWLRSTRSLVLTAAKLVRFAGAKRVSDCYNYDKTSAARLLQVCMEAACEILKVHPAYGASGRSRGASGAAAAATPGKETNLTAHMREVGFLAFGGIPTLLDVADDMLVTRFLREVFSVLRDVHLVDEAVHASLGALLCRIFCGQVAQQKHFDAASVVGSCFDILSPETAGLAIALVKDGLLAAAVDWALSAPQLDVRHTTGPPSNLAPSYVPVLLRALCEAVDGAGGTQQLSLHPILEGISTAETFYRNPAGIHRMRWAQRFREKGTWQLVKQELLPLITEVCCSFVEQASSQVPGQLDTSAVFRDVAMSAAGCANAGCTNLRGAREESLLLRYCGACKEARYCSRACQAQDWKRHKCACAAIRESKGLS